MEGMIGSKLKMSARLYHQSDGPFGLYGCISIAQQSFIIHMTVRVHCKKKFYYSSQIIEKKNSIKYRSEICTVLRAISM